MLQTLNSDLKYGFTSAEALTFDADSIDFNLKNKDDS